LDETWFERSCVFGFGFRIFSTSFHLLLSLLFRSQFLDLTGKLYGFFHQNIFSLIFPRFQNSALHPDPGRELLAEHSNTIFLQHFRRGMLVMWKDCKQNIGNILKEVVLDDLSPSRMDTAKLSNIETEAIVENVVFGKGFSMGCPLLDSFGLHDFEANGSCG
jgi:hypothetical protein